MDVILGPRLQAIIVLVAVCAVLGAPFWIMVWRGNEKRYRAFRDLIWTAMDCGDFDSVGRILRQKLAEARFLDAAYEVTRFYHRALHEYEKRKERVPKPASTTT